MLKKSLLALAVLSTLALTACNSGDTTDKAVVNPVSNTPAVTVTAPTAPGTVTLTATELAAIIAQASASAVAAAPVVAPVSAPVVAPPVAVAAPVVAAPKPQIRYVQRAAKKPAAPEFETVVRHECHQQQVLVNVEVQDEVKAPERSNMGMLLGGAIGALAGHQIGNGQGRTIATVAGAGAGAYAGDRMANSDTPAARTHHTEPRTSTVEVCNDVAEKVRR